MDKELERACADAVFGNIGLTVVESEEPDFVCQAANGFRFGIEVTEFFRTESDARLARIKDYAADLLSGGDYRHKDDHGYIRVEDVIYRVNATGQEIKLKAIPRDVPHHRVTIPALMDLIRGKDRKCERYFQRVAPVDLVINDVDQLLRFESVRQLLAPMIARENLTDLLKSRFREIYVLTLNSEKGVVAVPVRANLFASEIALFMGVFDEYCKRTDGPDTVGDFLKSLAVHLSESLPSAQYDVKNGIPRFIFASVAWCYHPEQRNIQIVDISADPLSDATLLKPDVECDELAIELREMLAKAKETQFGSYELYFPTRRTPVGDVPG